MTAAIPTQYGDLTSWTTSDPQSLPVASNAMMQSVADALDNVLGRYTTAATLLSATPTVVGYYTADNAPGGFFYWSGSAWTALVGTPTVSATSVITTPQSGWRVRVSSTGVLHEYIGSAWVPVIMGSQRIYPGLTNVNAGGTVTISDTGVISASGAVTSLRARDVFPTRFRAFRITFDVTTASASYPRFVFAVGGTNATGGYDIQTLTGINATPTASQSLDQTTGQLSPLNIAGARHCGVLNVFNVNQLDPTDCFGDSICTTDPMDPTTSGRLQVAVHHRTATAYDTIVLNVSTGNFSVNSLTVDGLY